MLKKIQRENNTEWFKSNSLCYKAFESGILKVSCHNAFNFKEKMSTNDHWSAKSKYKNKPRIWKIVPPAIFLYFQHLPLFYILFYFYNYVSDNKK